MTPLIVEFFSHFTIGQWVVVSVAGMLILGVLSTLQAWADGGKGVVAFSMVWGALVYIFLFILLTLLLAFISLMQWLWWM